MAMQWAPYGPTDGLVAGYRERVFRIVRCVRDASAPTWQGWEREASGADWHPIPKTERRTRLECILATEDAIVAGDLAEAKLIRATP